MPAPLRPSDPARLGPYRLLGRLGQGGQGVVHLGEDDAGTRAAVKTLHELGDDPRRRARLAQEVAAARLVEPFCTAQVLAADLDATPPWVASEYVEGPSLQEVVATTGPRRGAALTRIAVATATALAAIHDAGVVHRDFKPGNVLLGPDGARVIDFGIARASDATATGSVVGTPAYMAPEQLRGRDIGPAADVFAWAGVVVYAATGRPPFGDDDVMAVVARLAQGRPDVGDLAEPLRSLTLGCLAADPSQRPAARDVLLRLVARSTSAAGPAIALAAGERAAAPDRAAFDRIRTGRNAPDRDGGPGETWFDDEAADLAGAAGATETVDATWRPAPAPRPDEPGRPPRRARTVLLAVLTALVTLAVTVPLAVAGVRAFTASAGAGPSARPAGTPTRTPSGSPAATFTPAPTFTTVPAAFDGTWKGRVTEVAGNRGSGIDTVVLAVGRPTGTMRSVGCKGRLTVQHATSTTLTALVRYPCLYYSHQRVRFVVAAGGSLYETVWYRADDDVVSAEGYLTRTGP